MATEIIDNGIELIHDSNGKLSHRLHVLYVPDGIQPPTDFHWQYGWDVQGFHWSQYTKRLDLN